MSMLLFMAAAAAVRVPGQQFTDDEERRMMAEFAACVVHRRPRIVEAVVLKDRDMPYDLLNPDCIPDAAPHLSAYAPFVLIRYALADALIQRDASLTVRDLSSIAPLEHEQRLGDDVSEAAQRTAATSAAVSRYGECIVRTAPAEAGRLVRSGITTPQEDSAFAALKPALSSCLFQGQTGKFSRDVLRGTVALNYYRLAKAPRAAAAQAARQ
jgi:hypothetical protein